MLFVWVCMPALGVYIGYQFVSPNIGKVPEIKKGAQKILANGGGGAESPEPAETVSDASKPTIDISVQKGRAKLDEASAQKPKRSRRTRARTTAPQPEETKAPERDPASGDGATPPESDPASGAGGDGAGQADGLS